MMIVLVRDLVRGDFGFGKRRKSTNMVILQLPTLVRCGLLVKPTRYNSSGGVLWSTCDKVVYCMYSLGYCMYRIVVCQLVATRAQAATKQGTTNTPTNRLPSTRDCTEKPQAGRMIWLSE